MPRRRYRVTGYELNAELRYTPGTSLDVKLPLASSAMLECSEKRCEARGQGVAYSRLGVQVRPGKVIVNSCASKTVYEMIFDGVVISGFKRVSIGLGEDIEEYGESVDKVLEDIARWAAEGGAGVVKKDGIEVMCWAGLTPFWRRDEPIDYYELLDAIRLVYRVEAEGLDETVVRVSYVINAELEVHPAIDAIVEALARSACRVFPRVVTHLTGLRLSVEVALNVDFDAFNEVELSNDDIDYLSSKLLEAIDSCRSSVSLLVTQVTMLAHLYSRPRLF